MPSGFIGVTPESCATRWVILDLYKVWADQNKIEDCFVPDPRLLQWDIWNEIPLEFRPFFEMDPLLDRPTVKMHGKNSYEAAMIHKAVMWWNEWMRPYILKAFEEHQNQGGNPPEAGATDQPSS